MTTVVKPSAFVAAGVSLSLVGPGADLFIQKRPGRFFFSPTKRRRKTLHGAKTMFSRSQELWDIGKSAVHNTHGAERILVLHQRVFLYQHKAAGNASVKTSR